MNAETSYCLERVEAALDPIHLARTRQLWRNCRHYRAIHHLPVVCCCPAPDWPQYGMDEIQANTQGRWTLPKSFGAAQLAAAETWGMDI